MNARRAGTHHAASIRTQVAERLQRQGVSTVARRVPQARGGPPPACNRYAGLVWGVLQFLVLCHLCVSVLASPCKLGRDWGYRQCVHRSPGGHHSHSVAWNKALTHTFDECCTRHGCCASNRILSKGGSSSKHRHPNGTYQLHVGTRAEKMLRPDLMPGVHLVRQVACCDLFCFHEDLPDADPHNDSFFQFFCDGYTVFTAAYAAVLLLANITVIYTLRDGGNGVVAVAGLVFGGFLLFVAWVAVVPAQKSSDHAIAWDPRYSLWLYILACTTMWVVSHHSRSKRARYVSARERVARDARMRGSSLTPDAQLDAQLTGTGGQLTQELPSFTTVVEGISIADMQSGNHSGEKFGVGKVASGVVALSMVANPVAVQWGNGDGGGGSGSNRGSGDDYESIEERRTGASVTMSAYATEAVQDIV